MISQALEKTGHPNAVGGGASGATGGLLVVWVLSLFGITIESWVAVLIASACTATFLFIGREGLRGLFRRVWRGRS